MIRQALLAAELLRQLQHADLVADDLLVSRHRVVSSLRYSMSTLGDDTPTIAACQIWSKRIQINAGQSIAAVVRLDGLRAHLRTAPARPRPYPVRPGHLRHYSPAAAENRCLGPHQHPPRHGGDGLGLPPSARIRPRPRPPQQRRPITTRRYRPTTFAISTARRRWRSLHARAAAQYRPAHLPAASAAIKTPQKPHRHLPPGEMQ